MKYEEKTNKRNWMRQKKACNILYFLLITTIKYFFKLWWTLLVVMWNVERLERWSVHPHSFKSWRSSPWFKARAQIWCTRFCSGPDDCSKEGTSYVELNYASKLISFNALNINQAFSLTKYPIIFYSIRSEKDQHDINIVAADATIATTTAASVGGNSTIIARG